MLLPLGVKILWFVLSLTGLAGCWIVLLGLGRTIGSLWASVLYCVGCSVLEGIFCIGMIWKMDPYSMPGRFCTAQSVFIALGTFIMTGVVSTFAYITNKIVLKPKTWGDKRNSALRWKHAYALPTVGFPLAAVSVYIALALKLRAVRPVAEFYCDSSSPQWVRFLSFAGTPLLLSIPSLFLSIQSVLRAQETNRHIERARSSIIDTDQVSSDDLYTKPLRNLSFKRSRKLREKHSLSEFELESGVHMQSHGTESGGGGSPAGSLRFSAVSPCRLKRSSNAASVTTPDGTTQTTEANRRCSHSGLRIEPQVSAVQVTNNTVHFHIPIKPPSSCSERGHDIASLPDSDSSPSMESSPSFNVFAASGLTVYSAPNNPDSNVTITEVGRRRSESPYGSDLKEKHTVDSCSLAPGCESNSNRHSSGGENRISISSVKNTRASDSWINVVEMVNKEEEELEAMRRRSDHARLEWQQMMEEDSKSAYSDSKGGGEDEGEGDDDTLSGEMTVTRTLPKHRTHMKSFNNDVVTPAPFRAKRPPPPNLSGAIWRILLFQITFVFVQILGSLSTLVDVARRSAPSPLGTHHFAMLFAAWGPVFFFGSLRSVRRNTILQRNFRQP